MQVCDASPGAGGDSGCRSSGRPAPGGCYPVLPDVDGASSILAHGVTRSLPDAIAPSLASTPDFARRASWSHAIEVKKL